MNEKTNYCWYDSPDKPNQFEHDAEWYVDKFHERFGRDPAAVRLGVNVMGMRQQFVDLGIDNVFEDRRILDRQVMLEV
jgi:hypothetical protein